MSAIAVEAFDPFTLPSMQFVDRKRLPNCAAVYLVLEGREVLYIGSTNSLNVRWLNHHKLKSFVSKDLKIAWLECENSALLRQIEYALIAWFKPKLNCLKFDRSDFAATYRGKLSEKVYGVRLPVDIEPTILQLAGNNVSAWLRQAAIEKADRDTSKSA